MEYKELISNTKSFLKGLGSKELEALQDCIQSRVNDLKKEKSIRGYHCFLDEYKEDGLEVLSYEKLKAGMIVLPVRINKRDKAYKLFKAHRGVVTKVSDGEYSSGVTVIYQDGEEYTEWKHYDGVNYENDYIVFGYDEVLIETWKGRVSDGKKAFKELKERLSNLVRPQGDPLGEVRLNMNYSESNGGLILIGLVVPCDHFYRKFEFPILGYKVTPEIISGIQKSLEDFIALSDSAGSTQYFSLELEKRPSEECDGRFFGR